MSPAVLFRLFSVDVVYASHTSHGCLSDPHEVTLTFLVNQMSYGDGTAIHDILYGGAVVWLQQDHPPASTEEASFHPSQVCPGEDVEIIRFSYKRTVGPVPI